MKKLIYSLIVFLGLSVSLQAQFRYSFQCESVINVSIDTSDEEQVFDRGWLAISFEKLDSNQLVEIPTTIGEDGTRFVVPKTAYRLTDGGSTCKWFTHSIIEWVPLSETVSNDLKFIWPYSEIYPITIMLLEFRVNGKFHYINFEYRGSRYSDLTDTQLDEIDEYGEVCGY